MRSVTACSTPATRAPFEKTAIQRRDLGSRDVLIKIAYAGMSFRHTYRPRGVGRGPLPAGSRS
jgi:uncharacterized zinc-type alcohol dehydrogenase-like protein